MKEPILQAEMCPLTGVEKPQLKVVEQGVTHDFGAEGYQWYYPYKDKFLLIVQRDLYRDQSFWDNNRAAIYYLIENDIWPKGKMVDMALLEALIASSGIPDTPYEKIQELLLFISKESEYFGDYVFFNAESKQQTCWKIGLYNLDEMKSLIKESKELGFLDIHMDAFASTSVSLTIRGSEEAQKIKKSKESKIAFVAMSFDPGMIQIYNEWIEPAITESGFKPHIVLDQHPASDVTINDAILSGIKKAKFTIADFTHHKSGVYFEAGYALGRGQKVIYTCREDEIGTAHFDTRNYQHLVWKDGADLKRKLIDKIEVFIKA